MKSFKTAVASGVAFGVVFTGTGCSGGEPTPTNPNGTIEQVEHNLGGSELGKLPVGQTISFTAPDGDSVKLFNLTKQPVDKARFERSIGYFAGIGEQAPDSQLTIYPNGKAHPTQIDAFSYTRHVSEHDIVLVPEGTPMPPTMDNSTAAETLFFPDQSISVITQPQENGQPAPFESGTGIGTELCQSLINVDAIGDNSAKEQLVDKRLAQETICNTEGVVLQQSDLKADYNTYTAAVGTYANGEYIAIGAASYPIQLAVISPADYNAAQLALAQ